MSCLSFISNQEYTIPISNPLLPKTKTICQLKANLPLLHKQSFKPSCTPNSQYYPVGLSVMVLKKSYIHCTQQSTIHMVRSASASHNVNHG